MAESLWKATREYKHDITAAFREIRGRLLIDSDIAKAATGKGYQRSPRGSLETPSLVIQDPGQLAIAARFYASAADDAIRIHSQLAHTFSQLAEVCSIDSKKHMYQESIISTHGLDNLYRSVEFWGIPRLESFSEYTGKYDADRALSIAKLARDETLPIIRKEELRNQTLQERQRA